MGVGAKLFVLAGPVLVYGISSSIIVGLIAFFSGNDLIAEMRRNLHLCFDEEFYVESHSGA